MPQDGPRSRGPQPDPRRRPAPGVGDLHSRVLSGHDTPEGNVAAGTGALWQDVNPEGSGAIFKKTTPSGRTGWVELGSGFTPTHLFSGEAEDSTDDLSGAATVAKCSASRIWSDEESLYDTSTGRYAAPEAGWYIVSLGYHCVSNGVYVEWAGPGPSPPQAYSTVISSADAWGEVGGLFLLTEPGDIYVTLTPTAFVPGAVGNIRSQHIGMFAPYTAP